MRNLNILLSDFYKQLASLLLIFTLLISVSDAKAYSSSNLPVSTKSDWSDSLDPGWTCGQITGSRWEQWKKSVLLFAATTGYGFKGNCNAMKDGDGQVVRPGSVIVIFRDRANVVQYLGWYDSRLDRNREVVFGGISPVIAHTVHDIRCANIQSCPIYTQAEHQALINFISGYQRQLVAFEKMRALYRDNTKRVNGCVWPYTGCSTGSIMAEIDQGEIRVSVDFLDSAGNIAPNAKLYEQHYREDFFDFVFKVFFAIGLTVYGGLIGEYIGLVSGTAPHAAFAAGFGSFSSGILQGQDIDSALLSGIKGAGLAYTGKLVLNSFGDPDALVGVSGVGCPTGDRCWYFQMANGFPPLKHLAELHDPFINWSVDAFRSLGENGWYKAVTIAPFIVPGCLASQPCVAAGITITRENEGP